MTDSKYLKTLLFSKENLHIIDNILIQTLKKDYHFDTHFHSMVEFILCLKGEITITLFQTPVTVKKNEYLIIYPNIPHQADIPSDSCTFLQIHFYSDIFYDLYLDSLQDQNLSFLIDLTMNRRRYLHKPANPQLFSCVKFLKEEIEKKPVNAKRMADLYFLQLILLLSREINAELPSADFHPGRHLLLALQYINQNYQNKITIRELAEYCGITSRQLSSLFQTQLGLTYSNYLIFYRINKSIEIMNQNRNQYPLTQLALDTGFCSLQHFSKMFKEKMGLSPTKYFSLTPRTT